ncbi:CsxC family protein [Clostridium niameyense]|uniref:CsxC family protein n=1 Tax=Clostridium niameyense TaxID=1622073 RepID=UPI001969C369|nr:hypothetical protein [Clostridium niameyense]
MDIEQYNENCETIDNTSSVDSTSNTDNNPNTGNGKCNFGCGKVLSSKTLCLSNGTNLTPQGINGPVVVKTPVVLAEKNVQIDVEARLKLKRKYYEIKRIKKDVYLTQCELIPNIGITENGVPTTGKLFISGYVRENIEYASADCVSKYAVSGDINHTTEKIPFNCVTEVDYVNPPILFERLPQNTTDLYCDDRPCNENCKKKRIGKMDCEEYLEDEVRFTEKPYCELEGSRIFQADIQQEPCEFAGVKKYDELLQKMVVYVRIKVLQVQQVSIDC